MLVNVLNIFYFNPRTHKECDFVNRSHSRRFAISIHALTRSATTKRRPLVLINRISIHALTRSATKIRPAAGTRASSFQSTHSQGVRLICFRIASNINLISIHALTRSATALKLALQFVAHYFNPRTHKECDLTGNFSGAKRDIISIHALTRSATQIAYEYDPQN